MPISRTASQIKRTVQNIFNKTFDEDFNVVAVENLEWNPAGTMDRQTTNDLTLRLDDTTTADVIYIGLAAIGTATSVALWQIIKIDESGILSITWCDADKEFDNEWDERASLSYS